MKKTVQQELENEFARNAKHVWCQCMYGENGRRLEPNPHCKKCKGTGVVPRGDVRTD